MRVRTNRLPSGYRELEYIANTDTSSSIYQYLDTGWIPNYSAGFKIDLEIGLTSLGVRYCLLGSHAQGDNQLDAEISAGNYARLWLNSGSLDKYVSACVLGKNKLSFSYYGSTWTINCNGNTDTGTYTFTESSSNRFSLYMFIDRNQRWSTFSKGFKVYSCKIYTGTAVARNFIPAERVSDGKPGMYDLVNDVFYVNQGTGEFIKGPYANLSGKIATDIYYGYNQKISGGNFTDINQWRIYAGATATVANNEATVTKISGTSSLAGIAGATSDEYFLVKQNHKYMLVKEAYTDAATYIKGGIIDVVDNAKSISANTWTTFTDFFTRSGADVTKTANIYIDANSSASYFKVRNFMLIDLTDWFGSGNEPTTLADFKQKFTRDYYGTHVETIRLTQKQINALPTYGYNQLAKVNPKTGEGISNVGTLSISNGEIKTTSTNGGTRIALYTNCTFTQNHKYLSSIIYKASNTDTTMTSITGIRCDVAGRMNVFRNDSAKNGEWITQSDIFEYTNAAGVFALYLYKDMSYTDTSYSLSVKDTFMLIDLTDWYGAGSEPTTVAEFKESFPRIFYSYSKTASLNKYMINYNESNNSIMSCKIAGGSSDIYYGYNQKVSNGDFSNGTTDWLYGNVTLTASDNVLTATVNTAGQYFYNKIAQNSMPIISGNKYLVHTEMKLSKALKAGIFIGYLIGTTDYVNFEANTWTTIEKIKTATDSGTNQLQMGFEGQTTVGDTMQVRNVQLINLTEWFGAGKEPSTVAEFKEKFIKNYYGTCITPIKLTQKMIEALPNYGYNQLVLNGDFSNGTNNWGSYNQNNILISVSNNELTATFKTQLNSDAGSRYSWGFMCGVASSLKATINHKYLIICSIKTPYAGTYAFDFNNTTTGRQFTVDSTEINKWIVKGTISTALYDNNANKCILYPHSQSENIPVGTIIKCNMFMVIDLTDWYGSGSEPTTIAEFKQTFPKIYYPYSKKRLLNKYMINKLIN